MKSEALPSPKQPAGDLPEYCKQPRLKRAFGLTHLLRFVHDEQYFLANVFDFARIGMPVMSGPISLNSARKASHSAC